MQTVVAASILDDVGTTITTVISWIGSVITALIGTDGALAAIWPLVVVSISISAILLAIKIVRKFAWGM